MSPGAVGLVALGQSLKYYVITIYFILGVGFIGKDKQGTKIRN